VQEQRKRLNGFTQSHVIRQDGTQPPAAEKCQPGKALHLVWSQIALQMGRLWQKGKPVLAGKPVKPLGHPAFGDYFIQRQTFR